MTSLAKIFRPIDVSQCTHRIINRPEHLSPLGDRRRVATYDRLYERILATRSPVINQLSNCSAERLSYSRWLANSGFEDSDLIDLSTFRSMTTHRPYRYYAGKHLLSISDSSNLDCRASKGRIARNDNDLGVLNDNKTRGMIAHCSIGLCAESGRVEGMSDLIFFNRLKSLTALDSHRNNHHLSKQLSAKQKESHVWSVGASNSYTLLAALGCSRITHVFDAGADNIKLFNDLLDASGQQHWYDNYCYLNIGAQLPDQDFIIRIQHRKRKITKVHNEDGTISWWLNGGPVKGSVPQGEQYLLADALKEQAYEKQKRSVKLKAYNFINKRGKRRRRKARRAKLSNKHLVLNFIARNGQCYQLRVIHVKEDAKSLPKQEQSSSVDWLLITSIGLDDKYHDWWVVDAYRQRWQIEQLFRTLKKQGFRQAKIQLGAVSHLIRIITLAMQASAQVLRLVESYKVEESVPIEEEFTTNELELLSKLNKYYEGDTLKQKNPFSSSKLAYASWIIARMGGYKAYSKKPPGPITMARGLEKFRQYMFFKNELE